MSDALRRAVRTFIQAFVGSIITSGILSTASETGVVDWSAAKKVGVSALAGGVVAILTWAQNFLEDNTSVVPALLKAPPSGGVNPVPDPEGGGIVVTLLVIVVLVVLVLAATGNL